MRPTIADFLIIHYDKNNPATISVVKQEARLMTSKKEFKNMSQEEINKITVKRLKRNLVVRNRVAKLKTDPLKKDIFLLKSSLYKKNRLESLRKNPSELKKHRKYKTEWQLKFRKTEVGKEITKELSRKYYLRKKAKMLIFYTNLFNLLDNL